MINQEDSYMIVDTNINLIYNTDSLMYDIDGSIYDIDGSMNNTNTLICINNSNSNNYNSNNYNSNNYNSNNSNYDIFLECIDKSINYGDPKFIEEALNRYGNQLDTKTIEHAYNIILQILEENLEDMIITSG